MAKQEMLQMTQRDIDRVKVLNLAIQRRITQAKAGELLDLSREWVNRLCQKIKKIDEITSRYYLRLQAPDKHGVLAGIAKAFADKQVSIAAVTQKETRGKMATIVILIHQVPEKTSGPRSRRLANYL